MAAARRICDLCTTPVPEGALYCPMCGASIPSEISQETGAAFPPPAQPSEQAEQRTRIQRALGEGFELGGLLGRGGFAEVYAATDRKLQRTVAVKVLRHDLVVSRSLQERFLREARAAAHLRHPNIIPIYHVGEVGEVAYFIMPLIEGENLRDRLTREGPLSPEEVRRILREVAGAAALAHMAGIVHRDIKPENVMLEGSEGRVVVMDFGIAKATTSAESGLTGTGMIVGTPAYMSPEQASGSAQVDARSDVYSIGVVGFELLTGETPFRADSPAHLIAQHVATPAPSVSKVRPNTPADLAAAIDRCLAKDPDERWPDGAALAAALVAGAKHHAVGAARKRSWVVGVVLTSAAVAVVAGGIARYRSRQHRIIVGPAAQLRQLTVRGDACAPSLSPDGKFVAFLADYRYWIRKIGTDSAYPITEPSPKNANMDCRANRPHDQPRWSDDGRDLTLGMALSLAAGHVKVERWVGRASGDKAALRSLPDSVADSIVARRGFIVRVEDASRGTSPRDSSPVRLDVRHLGQARTTRLSLPGFTRLFLPGYPDPEVMGMNPVDDRILLWGKATNHAPLRLSTVSVGSGSIVHLRIPPPWAPERQVRPAKPDWAGWTPDGRGVYLVSDSLPGLWRFDVDPKGSGEPSRTTLLLPDVDFTGRSATPRCGPAASPEVAPEITIAQNRLAIGRLECSAQGIVAHLKAEGGRTVVKTSVLDAGSLTPWHGMLVPGRDEVLYSSFVNGSWSLFRARAPMWQPHLVAPLASRPLFARLSPDGSVAAVLISGNPMQLVLVNVQSGTEHSVLNSSPMFFVCQQLDWDPTSRRVYVGQSQFGPIPDNIFVRFDPVSEATDTLRPPHIEQVICPAISPDGQHIAAFSFDSVRIVVWSPTTPSSQRHLGDQGMRYPLGWLNPNEIVVLEDKAGTDSSTVWAYSLQGKTTVLGKVPHPCWGAALAPDRSAITCTQYRVSQDVWLADDFDPYLKRARP